MKKYVVLASAIGSPEHPMKLQGEVVDETFLGGCVGRYLDLGSIREATEVEAKLDKVEVSHLQRESSSTEELVSQLRADLEIAKARNLSLSDELSKAQAELAETRKKQAKGK